QYTAQQEKGWKLDMVLDELEHYGGTHASWGDRTYELIGDFRAALEAQEIKAVEHHRADAEARLLAEQTPQREEQERRGRVAYGNELLRTGQVVEGRVWLCWKGGSPPEFNLELNEGLHGTLSATFLKCDGEEDRQRRCASLQKEDRLRVQVVRVHNHHGDPR